MAQSVGKRMYELKRVYGKNTFDKWEASRPSGAESLECTQFSSRKAWEATWRVNSYQELKRAVDFLSVMNKRLALYFRGQSKRWDPVPSLFRDTWRVYGTGNNVKIVEPHRYFELLDEIGSRVYRVCREMGVPRWRGLRDIRESQWAVVQHYELWPTPLIDVTHSLRVAAAFALGWDATTAPRHGYVVVAGLPYGIGSINFDIDEHIVLARLQAVCRPDARRPHLQDGSLVGRFPFSMDQKGIDQKSGLQRRAVAVIEVSDEGDFWDADFPRPSRESLLPSDEKDPLARKLREEFGPDRRNGIAALARTVME